MKRTFEEIIKDVPAGFYWLARVDDEEGFFFHVMPNGFNNLTAHEMESFFEYDNDLRVAAHKAISRAIQSISEAA